jgi:hypothetical protein
MSFDSSITTTKTQCFRRDWRESQILLSADQLVVFFMNLDHSAHILRIRVRIGKN